MTLVSEAAFAADNYATSCVNFVQTTKQRRDAASNPSLVTLREEAEAEALASASGTAEATSTGGLSVAEGGVIGAMVTLGTVALFIASGWFFGAINFGRRSAPRFPSASSVSESF